MIFDDNGHVIHVNFTDCMKQIMDTHNEELCNNVDRLLYRYFGLKSAEVTLLCTYIILMMKKENGGIE